MRSVTELRLASKYRMWGFMRCQEVDDVFLDPSRHAGAVIPIDVARHFLRCEACHALYRGLRDAVRATPVPISLRLRILSMVRKSPEAGPPSLRCAKK
jgi:hypothetical protein